MLGRCSSALDAGHPSRRRALRTGAVGGSVVVVAGLACGELWAKASGALGAFAVAGARASSSLSTVSAAEAPPALAAVGRVAPISMRLRAGAAFAASFVAVAGRRLARSGRQRPRGLGALREKVAEAVPETPVSGESATTVTAAGVAALEAKESPSVSLDLAFRRMWTAADWLHVHAVSGVAHTLVGLVYLLDVAAGDFAKLSGATWSEHVPLDLVLASMFFGAVNAVSGLQPALLPRPFKDLLQLLGIGEKGNLKSAGFVNTAAFYFFLTYQSLRVLPAYPTWLQPADPAFAFLTIAALVHAIFIINSWVSRGKLSQGFAIGMSAPLMLNLPVSMHLLLEGQSWVERLTAVYPGWPEVFFVANYCLAWAGSVVTFILSLYERKVIGLTERLLLTVLTGVICFTLIPLHAYLLVPQWFQGQWLVMLTLTPP